MFNLAESTKGNKGLARLDTHSRSFIGQAEFHTLPIPGFFAQIKMANQLVREGSNRKAAEQAIDQLVMTRGEHNKVEHSLINADGIIVELTEQLKKLNATPETPEKQHVREKIANERDSWVKFKRELLNSQLKSDQNLAKLDQGHQK